MFASITPLAGTQPFNDWFVTSTVQAHPLGATVTAVDPYWGTGKFVYLKSNDVIIKGSVVVWDETYTAVLCPNTTLQGFPVGFAMYPSAAGVYFWAQTEGRVVYKTSATVAADAAVALSAAGVLGASAAGKQIVNLRNRVAATGTITGSANTYAGTNVLYFPKGYDGYALGLALTGTGVGASAVVAGLDPDGKRVYTGTAIGTLSGANQTATGFVTVTGTYTGYGSGIANNAFAQGAIT